MWRRPPRYLGLIGWDRWQSRSDASAKKIDALDELVADAFSFVFLDRGPSLLAQLQHKPHVEGLVALNLRHFIHERQARHDPLGRRVYKVLHDALCEAESLGEIHRPTRDGRLRDGDLLTFRPGAATTSEIDASAIERSVTTWCDRLVPSLVETGGVGYVKLLAEVRSLVGELDDSGVSVFRLRDLRRPLARDLRARWRALTELAFTMKESNRPTFEEREHFEALAAQVERHLDDSDERPRIRQLMISIWRLLVTGSDDRSPSVGVDDLFDERAPSQRTVASALGVSRSRVQTAFSRLRVIVRRSRAELASRRGPLRDATGLALPTAPSVPLDPSDMRRDLARRALEVAARARAERRGVALEARRPGEVFVARGAEESLCEWAVLERDEAEGRVLVVPADTSGLAGPRDLRVHAQEPGGALTLRCRFARWIEATRLVEVPSRRLGPETVSAARELARGAGDASEMDDAADDHSLDPDLREWLDRVALEADGLRD